MPRTQTQKTRLALLIAAALAAPAAHADRLPLRGHHWIETRGPWRIQRDRVLFVSAAGRLSSLPLAETALDEGSRETEKLAPRPLSDYPWGGPVEMPVPEPEPMLRRPPRGAKDLTSCVLANAGPGAPVALACDPAAARRPLAEAGAAAIRP